jgi:hypothetical protein
MTRSRDWLLLNAVESWLYHYQNAPAERFNQYQQLRDELYNTYINSRDIKDAEEEKPAPKPRTTRKRTNANKTTKTV